MVITSEAPTSPRQALEDVKEVETVPGD